MGGGRPCIPPPRHQLRPAHPRGDFPVSRMRARWISGKRISRGSHSPGNPPCRFPGNAYLESREIQASWISNGEFPGGPMGSWLRIVEISGKRIARAAHFPWNSKCNSTGVAYLKSRDIPRASAGRMGRRGARYRRPLPLNFPVKWQGNPTPSPRQNIRRPSDRRGIPAVSRIRLSQFSPFLASMGAV